MGERFRPTTLLSFACFCFPPTVEQCSSNHRVPFDAFPLPFTFPVLTVFPPDRRTAERHVYSLKCTYFVQECTRTLPLTLQLMLLATHTNIWA